MNHIQLQIRKHFCSSMSFRYDLEIEAFWSMKSLHYNVEIAKIYTEYIHTTLSVHFRLVATLFPRKLTRYASLWYPYKFSFPCSCKQSPKGFQAIIQLLRGTERATMLRLFQAQLNSLYESSITQRTPKLQFHTW